jgi:DNA-directed RNA polymerase subunit E'/Rpb7
MELQNHNNLNDELQNHNNLSDELFNEFLLKEKIIIEPKDLNHKINKILEEKLKEKIEEKCISEGFVKKDSIEIIKKGLGELRGSQFNGNMSYELLYKAQICNPKIGQTLKAKVKFIKKIGILAYNGPLSIIIGKEFHHDLSIFEDINPDDILEVQVIASKFSLNDREIKVIANLKIEQENEDTMILGDLINNMEEEDKQNDIENNQQQDIDEESNEDLDNLSLDSLSEDDDDDDEEEYEEDDDDASFDNGNLDDEEKLQETEIIEEDEEDANIINIIDDEISDQGANSDIDE